MTSRKLPPYAILPLALLAGMAAMAPGHATAQSGDPHREDDDLDQIIVTASPLHTNAEDLSRPVEVLAGEALDNAKANSLGETVGRLPGVQASYFGPGVGRPIIRGMDGARVQVLSGGLGAGDVSTVSVDHAVSIEPFLAEQIEVLKGPATLLYGSGAIGGAVNVVDGRVPEKTLDTPLQGRAELRGASGNDERTGMLRMDAASASGRWVFHLDGLHRETGDYRIPGFAEHLDDTHQGEEDHDTETGVRGRLPNSFVRTDSGAMGVSYIGERGHLGVAASLFNNRYGIPGHAHGHDAGAGEPEESVSIAMDQRRSELRAGLRALGPFDNLRFKLANTTYTHTEFEGDAIGTVFENDVTEARLELLHLGWAGWDGAFGLQTSRRDFVAIGDEAFVPASQSKDIGAFWIGHRDLGPTTLELGARHDRNRIDVDADVGPSRTFDATSLSAALRWNFGEDLHLSFGLDHAQRTPGAEELYSDGLHVATGSYEFGNANLGTETANRAEVGLHWHHETISLNAAIFGLDFKDFIYLADTGVTDGDTPVRVWNQSDARFTGAEAELQWDFLDNASGRWSLRAFGDTVRGRLNGAGSRITTFRIEDENGVREYTAPLDLDGNLPRIAPSRFGAELRWSNDHWRAGIGAIRYASQTRTAAFEEPSAGYTLMNADVAWHRDTEGGQAWELFLNGNNLLDEEARPHTSFLKELSPLPGRSIAFGVRVFF